MTTADHLSEERLDGRRARGERTRMRVLESLLSLVEEGQLRPTAQDVAARAGVALRTVYHHFEDVEALRRTALDLQLTRHREILRPMRSDADLDERITTVARQSRRLLEAITPIRRATLIDESFSSEMSDGVRKIREVRRAHLQSTFKPELEEQPDGGKLLLDAIDCTTAWQSWYFLRINLGRSATASENVMLLELQALLSKKQKSRS